MNSKMQQRTQKSGEKFQMASPDKRASWIVCLVSMLVGASSLMQAQASDASQKTITVVIKFDGKSQVEDVTYHSSQF